MRALRPPPLCSDDFSTHDCNQSLLMFTCSGYKLGRIRQSRYALLVPTHPNTPKRRLNGSSQRGWLFLRSPPLLAKDHSPIRLLRHPGSDSTPTSTSLRPQ